MQDFEVRVYTPQVSYGLRESTYLRSHQWSHEFCHPNKELCRQFIWSFAVNGQLTDCYVDDSGKLYKRGASKEGKNCYAGLVTAPERIQRVQTLTYMLFPPFVAILTRCRLGSQRRLFLLWAWLTWLPVTGPLPQISHFLAMIELLIYSKNSINLVWFGNGLYTCSGCGWQVFSIPKPMPCVDSATWLCYMMLLYLTLAGLHFTGNQAFL